MTITPTSALPGLPVAAPGEDAAGGASSGDFLAVILDALAAGAAPAVAQVSQVSTGGPGHPTEEPAAPAGGVPAAEQAETPPGPPLPVTFTATPPAPAPQTPAGSSPLPETPADAAELASLTEVAPTTATSPAQGVPAPAGNTSAGDAPASVPVDAGSSGTDRSETPPAAGVPLVPAGPAEPANLTEETSSGPDPVPSGRSEPSTAPDQVVARADASTPAATTTPLGAGAADRVRAAGVPAQVFPEITRLVSRGDGVHRVTLTLAPEALGEVRVVMTMRAGVVHVHLAAGDGDARAALTRGSPELARLLEMSGAADTKIVVRDLAPGPAPTVASTPQFAAGGDRQQHTEHAWTRGQHSATDGTNDTTPLTGAGADPLRSIEPVRDPRTAGVDVTV